MHLIQKIEKGGIGTVMVREQIVADSIFYNVHNNISVQFTLPESWYCQSKGEWFWRPKLINRIFKSDTE